MRNQLFDLMKNDQATIWRIVDKNALTQLINGQSPWPWYGQLMGTPQTMAYMLQIDCWLREYSIDILV
jgi:asparagine synthase (glutamine-hydrolysing)